MKTNFAWRHGESRRNNPGQTFHFLKKWNVLLNDGTAASPLLRGVAKFSVRKFCRGVFLNPVVSFGSLSGIASLLLLLPSCKEVGPDINLHGSQHSVSDTTYVESPVAPPELKNVLIEEFTGVRCPNCPQGHQIVAAIKAQYPGRVVGIALHPINSLGYPFPFSTQDLENQKSQTLFDYLGQIGLEPAGGIDRNLFTGQTNVLLDKSQWTGYSGTEISAATPVNLLLNRSYDSTSRQLTVIVELHYTNSDTISNRLTIALTESNIVSAQLNGNVVDTFYTHNDVMRDIITSTEGDAITPPRQAGRVVRKVYKTTLNSLWNPANMSVIAFVHEFENSKVVYQVKEISVE